MGGLCRLCRFILLFVLLMPILLFGIGLCVLEDGRDYCRFFSNRAFLLDEINQIIYTHRLVLGLSFDFRLSQVILNDFRYLDFNWALIFENRSSTILAVLIQAGFMFAFRVLLRVFLSILYLIAPVRCAEFAHDKLHYIDFVTTAFGMVWVKLWAARRARKVDA